MTKENGRVMLDLSELVARVTLRIGDYECSISGDLSVTSLARLAKAFGKLGDMTKDSIDLADLGVSEEEMWALADEVLAGATPPPPGPAKELLTTAATIKMLSFLAGRLTAQLTETARSKT
ncbi:MAG TPA: hypothetical protein VJ253_03160 [Dehalococcoidia bacterium]|nr:hypothetical protein [Dehalococcoidia bacterium]